MKINPLILIFAFYAIGIISLFLPAPFFFGIIFFIPAVIGSIILYIRRIIRIYRERDEQKTMLIDEDLLKIPERQLEKIKPIETIKIPDIKYEVPAQKELITIEQIKEISSQVKEVIDDSKQCKKFISKIKLPVSSTTTVNVQITPDIFLVISVRPDEIVVYRHDPEVKEIKTEEKKSEKPKVETKKKEIKQSEPVKLIEQPKLTYQTIIEMVLKGKGKKKVTDVLSECKKIKDLKQWDRLFPMANTRLGCPVIFSYTEENGVKTKYAEWFESK